MRALLAQMLVLLLTAAAGAAPGPAPRPFDPHWLDPVFTSPALITAATSFRATDYGAAAAQLAAALPTARAAGRVPGRLLFRPPPAAPGGRKDGAPGLEGLHPPAPRPAPH